MRSSVQMRPDAMIGYASIRWEQLPEAAHFFRRQLRCKPPEGQGGTLRIDFPFFSLHVTGKMIETDRLDKSRVKVGEPLANGDSLTRKRMNQFGVLGKGYLRP